jgi:hypothetical protein
MKVEFLQYEIRKGTTEALIAQRDTEREMRN